MLNIERPLMSVALDETHFGDDPLEWTMNGNSLGARRTQSILEAARLRKPFVAGLRSIHTDSDEYRRCLELAQTLEGCCPKRPCFSGACPICMRATQRWFIEKSADALGHRLINRIQIRAAASLTRAR